MKNLKSTEPINLQVHYGWCADVYEGEESTCKTDICTVWGSTEEELNYRVAMIKKAYEMQEALKWAYEVLSRVDHSYAERNTPLGQMRLSNMRFILKELES